MKFPTPFGRLLLVTLAIVLSSTVFGQEEATQANSGSVFGQIKDAETEGELAEVRVLIQGTPFSTLSGSDGRWSILMVPPGVYNVVFSKSGFEKTLRSEVRVVAGEATRLDVIMRLEMYELPLLEVVGDPLAGLDGELLLERQEANIIFDAIGSEQISRSGFSDAAGLLTKVTGATVVDGRTAVIRGLSDRYTTAMLNGAEIPSADPYKKSAQLDMIPSTVINDMTVTKTFTPDQPGAFTGGAINITTKSFPEEFIFRIAAGVGYNTQSSLNDDFIAAEGSSTDFLGIDSGMRALPPPLDDPEYQVPNPPRRARRTDTAEDDAARQAQADELQGVNEALGVTQFEGEGKSQPLNHKFDIAVGDTVEVAKRPLGYFATISYNHRYRYYPNGVYERWRPGLDETLKTYNDRRGVDEVNWAAMANLAYDVNENNLISFNFLFNQNGENNVRQRVGQNFQETIGTLTQLNTIHWIERSLMSFMLQGDHTLENLGNLDVDWLAAYANTQQEEPDLRYFNHFVRELPSGDTLNSFANSIESPQRPSRYWRDLDEDNYNGRLDFRKPFDQWSGLEADVKFGLFGSYSRRDFIERIYDYDSQTNYDDWLFNGVPNNFLTPENLRYSTEFNSRGQTNYVFPRYVNEQGRSTYDGKQDINAVYAMTDLPLTEAFTFVGGARLESTDLSVFSESANSGSNISQTDVLPAAGLIFTFYREQMKLRLNYGKTVARPTYREIAPYRSYDIAGDEVIEGNPNLTMSEIDNFDLRWDWFLGPGEVLSFGGFYKDLQSPIEKYNVTLDGSIITFINRETAQVYGLEFEARKNLMFISPRFENFSAGFNLALIQSQTELTEDELGNKQIFDPDVSETRPMFDQSPVILNADLNFDKPEWRTSATISFNYTAERIYLANGIGPDIYEWPGPILNFTWIQGLGDHWSAKFAAKNLLNPTWERTYGNDSRDFLYQTWNWGTVFELSFTFSY